jgi:hypothetical protein
VETTSSDSPKFWIDPTGGIKIKAVTPEGDPVGISSSQAPQLAEALQRAGDLDDDGERFRVLWTLAQPSELRPEAPAAGCSVRSADTLVGREGGVAVPGWLCGSPSCDGDS